MWWSPTDSTDHLSGISRNSQTEYNLIGIIQLMAGGGIALIGIVLVPQLSSLIIFRMIISAVRPFRLSLALIRTCIQLI